jgi:hypothetical protein
MSSSLKFIVIYNNYLLIRRYILYKYYLAIVL